MYCLHLKVYTKHPTCSTSYLKCHAELQSLTRLTWQTSLAFKIGLFQVCRLLHTSMYTRLQTGVTTSHALLSGHVCKVSSQQISAPFLFGQSCQNAFMTMNACIMKVCGQHVVQHSCLRTFILNVCMVTTQGSSCMQSYI